MQKQSHARSNLGTVELDPKNVFSCREVFAHNGNLIAVPYSVPKFSAPKKVFNPKSISHTDYAPKRVTSCGDTHKPLMRYDPNAPRSRLPVDEFKPAFRNKSQIQFDSQNNPRRFLTVSMNMYRGESGMQSSNRSIVAAKVKYYHTQQAR